MTLGYAARASSVIALLLPACVENTGIADNDRSSSTVVEVDSGNPDPVDGSDGGGAEGDAGASKVEGTAPAAGCTSTTAIVGNSCFGFYCGTNEADILAETTTGGGCSTPEEVAQICLGHIAEVVSKCARADPFNPAFQETVKTCVRNSELANVEQITDACLDCYAVSADCARMKCSAQCLAGDSLACDQCRENNKCTPNFYGCAGVPDPQ